MFFDFSVVCLGLVFFFFLFASSLVFLGIEMNCERTHYPLRLQFSINKTATIHKHPTLSAALYGTDHSQAR